LSVRSTHNLERERRSRHLKIYSAIVIHLDRGGNIELGKRNLLRGGVVEHPERSTGDRVVMHFFNMLVAENQRRRGLLLWLRPIARFHISLQPVDFSIQLIEVAHRAISTGIRILIVSIVKRIVIPAVITVGIISSVRVVGIIAASVEASAIVVGVSNPKTNAGAVAHTSAMKCAGGAGRMSGKGVSATGGEVTAAATAAAPLCPHRQREQNQAERRYVQPAPHSHIIAQFGWFPQSRTCGRHTKSKAPRRFPRSVYADLPALFLGLCLGLCLGSSRRLRRLGGFPRLLYGLSLSWPAHFSRSHSLCRSCLCRSYGFHWHHRLRCRGRLDLCRCRRSHRSRGPSFSLPLSPRLAARRHRNSRGGRGRRGSSLSSSASLRGWRWRRWRRWRRQRLEIFQGLRPRTQLAIQQQHEHVVRDLRILRHLRRDSEFRHLRQRNLLLHLPPLGEKILDLLRHRLLPRRDRQKQNHLGTRRRQQLPCPRRRRRFFTRQTLSETVGVRIQILPRFDQILARNRPAQIRNILVAQPLR